MASRGAHALHGTTSFPPGSAAGEWIIFRGGGRPAAASYRVSPLRCATLRRPGRGGHCRAQAGNCRSRGPSPSRTLFTPTFLARIVPTWDPPSLWLSLLRTTLPPHPLPPLPTPRELLLRLMCQTLAICGAPSTPLDSRTCKNRLPDPREERGYLI